MTFFKPPRSQNTDINDTSYGIRSPQAAQRVKPILSVLAVVNTVPSVGVL